MAVHHDQGAQAGGVDLLGGAEVHDKLAAPLAHFVQQGVRLLPEWLAGHESEILGRLQHPAIGLHGGNGQRASRPGYGAR